MSKRDPPRKFLSENHENTLYYLVYFKEDHTYEIFSYNSIYMANYSGEPEFSVKIQGETYTARVIFSSSSKFNVDMKKNRLEKKLQIDQTIGSSSSFLNSTLDEESAVSPEADVENDNNEFTRSKEQVPTSQNNISEIDDNARPRPPVADSGTDAKLNRILSELRDIAARQIKIEGQQKAILKKMKRTFPDDQPNVNEHPRLNADPIIFNGEDLSRLPGSRASKFGLQVARKVLSGEYMKTRMLSPESKKSKRAPASPEKEAIIKRAVLQRFPNGWQEAKAAINQSGLDAKRIKKN